MQITEIKENKKQYLELFAAAIAFPTSGLTVAETISIISGSIPL